MPLDTVWDPSAAETDAQLTQPEYATTVDEVVKVQEEVGAGARGSDASVAARLTRVDDLATAIGQVGGHTHLEITNGDTTPDAELTITADRIVIGRYAVESVNVTGSLAATGKNGLNSDTEGNAWYALWLGYDPAAEEVAMVFDPYVAGPQTLTPHASLSTFTDWVYVGAWYNDASSNLLRGLQVNGLMTYDAADLDSTLKVDAPSSTTTTWTTTTIPGVPPHVRQASVLVRAESLTTDNIRLLVRPEGSTHAGRTLYGAVEPSDNGAPATEHQLLMNADQEIELKWSAASAGASVDLQTSSYRDPKV